MFAILGWWLALSVIGWASWPLVARIFEHAPGKGYAYARGAGLLFVSYLFWITSHLWGVPNRTAVLWAFVALIGLLGSLIWVRYGASLREAWPQERAHILIGEFLFAACFALYAVHRSYDAAITHTEQPMDFALLNGVLASTRMPPLDPWFAGASIHYYYFGYVLAAVMIRLVGLSSGVGYNLALAQTFALTVLTAYGLIYDVLRAHTRVDFAGQARACAVIGALALALASNLEGVLEGIKAAGWGSEALFRWFGVPGLAEAASTRSWLPEGLWWWRASRILTDVRLNGQGVQLITEFPAFSFILGDLHPHLMALPYLLLALAAAFEGYAIARQGWDRSWWKAWRTWAIPLIIGALGVINTWDLPVGLVIALIALLFGGIVSPNRAKGHWARYALAAVWLIAWSIIPFLPYYALVRLPVRGLGFATLAKTPLRHWGLCFGLWLLPIVGELWASRTAASDAAWSRERGKGWAFWVAWPLILLIPWGFMALVGGWPRAALGIVYTLAKGPWLILVQSALLAALLADLSACLGLEEALRDDSRIFARLLALVGVGVTYAVEFLYVRDVFESRMNTVFKLYYQAWALLGVAALYAIFRLRQMEGWPRVFYLLSGIFLIACSYYPVAAAYTQAKGYRGSVTLDGTAFLQRSSPAEYRAYRYLLTHRREGEIIVEAPGESYAPETNRLSAWTGVPTPIGWVGHQVQWRGESEVLRRKVDIEYLYTVPDPLAVKALLRHYGASLLYVGPTERERFGLDERRLAWFASFLPIRYADEEIRFFGVP